MRSSSIGPVSWVRRSALVACAGALVVACDAGDVSEVIIPDVGIVEDAGTDSGARDVPAVTDLGVDVPDVPAPVDMPAAMDAPVALDAPAMDTAAGCRSNADCASDPRGRVCDTSAGRCVACLPSADTCEPSRHCDPATLTCIDGCRSDEGCVSAADGGATRRRCDVTRHECGECVANTDCPVGRQCAGGLCVAGCSATSACPTGETCCSGACVDLMASPVSCGACDNRCGLPNAVGACRGGACNVGTCVSGYANCDATAANGCEVNVETDTGHCGSCGNVCPTGPHVSARTCVVGRCGITCEVGFADCDGNPANGCEVDLVTDPAQCGTCGTVCPSRANAPAACVSRRCALVCASGYGSCDGDEANGCETDTATSEAHCGACGRACSAPNATAGCSGSMCQITACASGFGNCDGIYGNGCETQLNTTANCGACGRTVTEVCDGADNDCDGVVDDGCPTGIRNPTDTATSLQYGGSGGGSFADVCVGGAAVGFDGRAGSRIDQLGVRCMQLTLREDRSVSPFRYTVTAVPPIATPGVRGGSGGSPFSASCDSGSFVSGISGQSGSRVDRFAFTCGYWNVVGTPTTGWRLELVGTAARGPYGGTGGAVFNYECPNAASGQHTAVTTFFGRSGSELDAIGVRCGLPAITVR